MGVSCSAGIWTGAVPRDSKQERPSHPSPAYKAQRDSPAGLGGDTKRRWVSLLCSDVKKGAVNDNLRLRPG